VTNVVNKHVAQSEDLIIWLDRFIERLSIPTNDRAVIVACCLDVALEHHKSIVLTTTESYYGSAFALIRLEFEAYVRGVWLSNCATDKEVERFKKSDKLDRKFGDMIADIEALEAFDVGVLSKIKRESWNTMCSFTHTGRLQVVRRLTTTEIAPSYPEEEVVGTLDAAGCVALWSALAILNVSTGELTNRDELAIQLLDRLKEFVGPA
jgi:uncharacterized protein DUF6988